MDTVEDVQELCAKNLIKHFVMFDDLYPSTRQVQVGDCCPPYSTVSVYIHVHILSCGQWRIKILLIKK